MIPNPGEKLGNPVHVLQPVVRRVAPSPVPTSVEFGNSMRAMRIGSAKKSGSHGGGNDNLTNIMQLMLMQQQADQEQRTADREHRIFLAEQEKIEREERAHQLQLEREERAIQAREDRIQQQQDCMQQQQFMNMMMMQMMGGAKKRARGEESDTDNDEDTKSNKSTPKRTPRKK